MALPAGPAQGLLHRLESRPRHHAAYWIELVKLVKLVKLMWQPGQ
ncbi:hypothetical protein [Cupriavidus sp. CuC1]